MNYTLVLIISIVLLSIMHWNIDHKQRSLTIYRNKSLKDINGVLEKLSMEMNNQTLCVRTVNNGNEITILKYQENDTWGMKVILNSGIYVVSEIEINSFLETEQICKSVTSDNNIIFELGSDLLRVNLLISFILTKVLNIQSKLNLILFLRKRV